MVSTLGLAFAGAACADLPPGFVDALVVGGWNQAVGVTFDAQNVPFVWEKGGRVWRVINGQRVATPVIDLSQEVGDWRDFGLLGFALDPNFESNGYIYLLYTVDFHHARYFGTPQYNPNANEYFRDTIGRLTRYTCATVNGQVVADPASRRVLIGESLSTGIPSVHQSHHVGTIMFGNDGSLMVTCGDGASYEEIDNGGARNGSSHTAVADGVITPAQDVGAFRSQIVNCHAGKVLRVNPATGDGLPDNPFYTSAEPRSARSRVYAMGFRNPFRASVRPGTGGVGAGPGVLYVGDVGWYQREEVNVLRGPGANCGWPLFEGLTPSQAGYTQASPANRDAPNTLYNGTSCSVQYLNFRDLIVQDTLAAPSWPNPCNPAVQISPSIFKFEHTRPVVEYGHGGATRVGSYLGNSASEINIDAPGSPVAGVPFGGDSVTGGVWITSQAFPAPWRNKYYFADFVGGHIRAMTFSAQDQLEAITPFQTRAGAVVCLAQSRDGWLYYVNYDENGASALRRISFGVDTPPVARIAASPRWGAAPLDVSFSSEGSRDPDNLAISYYWDFGDGFFSTEANPVHTYTGDRDLTAQGTFVARVLTLSPPGPQGSGGRDPEILRDNTYPPVRSGDPATQYDTFHNGDQGDDDWFGWTFAQPWKFTSMYFQEGMHFGNGGWFDSRRVEILGLDNVWRQAPGLIFSPSYFRNNAINFESFWVTFQPAIGTGIRLRGNPGGASGFLSAAELRAFGQPVSNTGPQRYDPVLYVTDAVGQVATATTTISINNTPPVVRITSPVNGALFNDMAPQMLPLRAEVTDAEHDPASLTSRWDVELRHDEHTHPEPPIFARDAETRIEGHGNVGDTFTWRFTLTVTDPMGLSTVAYAEIFPNPCRADFNADGFLDFFDYDAFTSCFEGAAPCPPGATADVNMDGFVDFFDYGDFVDAFQAGC